MLAGMCAFISRLGTMFESKFTLVLTKRIKLNPKIHFKTDFYWKKHRI